MVIRNPFLYISIDPQARLELQRRNLSGVPAFIIGDDAVVGLDKEKILKLVDHRVIEGGKCSQKMRIPISELVQLKLNIETSVGESTPTEAENGRPTPTYRSGSLTFG